MLFFYLLFNKRMSIISRTKRNIFKESKKYQKCHQYLFLILLYASYIFYFLFFLTYSFPETTKKLIKIDPKKTKNYLNNITFFINAYVSVILIYKFNPWQKSSFTKFDRKLVFVASTVVFTTTFFTKVV